MRLKECDTVFLLDFSTEICIEGAKNRIGKKREDLPWVEEKLDEKFEQNIINFISEKLPQIYELLDKYKNNIKTYIFKTRKEAEDFIQKQGK